MQTQLRQGRRKVRELVQVAQYVCVCVTLGNCQTHLGTCYLLGNLWVEELTEPRTTANQELCSEPRVAEPLPSPRHFLSITASHFPVPTANCQVFHVANFLNMLHRLFFFPPPLLWLRSSFFRRFAGGVSSFPFHNLVDFCLAIKNSSQYFCILTLISSLSLTHFFLSFSICPSFRLITCRHTHKLNNHSVPECVKKNSTNWVSIEREFNLL